MPARSVYAAVFRSCSFTNNILGTVVEIAENHLETEEQNETDEVPELPRLPRTFLAHHAKGTRRTFGHFSSKKRCGLHICHSTTCSCTRSRRAQTHVLVYNIICLAVRGAEQCFSAA